MPPRTDPWATLGLNPSADAEEVKKKWRELAKEVHPDFNPSPDASQRFMELQKAKNAILSVSHRPCNFALLYNSWLSRRYSESCLIISLPVHVVQGRADYTSAHAERLRRDWRAGGARSRTGFAAWHSSQTFKTRTALAFSASCFIAGCGLFAGAILTYKVMMDEYSYTRPDKVEERLRVYNPQRERLLERMVAERAEGEARRQQQGGSTSTSSSTKGA